MNGITFIKILEIPKEIAFLKIIFYIIVPTTVITRKKLKLLQGFIRETDRNLLNFTGSLLMHTLLYAYPIHYSIPTLLVV